MDQSLSVVALPVFGPVGVSVPAQAVVQSASTLTSTGPNQGGRSSDSYGYDPLNRLNTANTVTPNYGYDAADNLTQLPNGAIQAFDSENELTNSGNITLVRAITAGSSTPTSLGQIVNIPPGSVQAGDQIVVASTHPVTGNSLTSVTDNVNGSYSQIAASTAAGGLGPINSVVYRKTAVGTETSVTISYSGLTSRAIVVAIYRGVDAAAPVDATATSNSGSAGAQSISTQLSATSYSPDRLVMFAGAGTSTRWVAPNGMTDEGQMPETLASIGMSDQTLAQRLPAGSDDGTRTASCSCGSQVTGILLALKPAFTAFTYDANGNRTRIATSGGATTTFAYDQANRLSNYNGTATYQYNGDGLRIAKAVGSTTQRFVWDVSGSLPLLLDDGQTSYVYGAGGNPLEQTADAAPGPITLVGKGAAAAAAATALTTGFTTPSGGSFTAAANDQILISVTQDGNGTASAPGYAVVDTVVTTNAVQPSSTTLLRRLGSGTESSVTVTLSQPAAEATIEAVVYRGVDPVNPTGPIDGPVHSSTGSGNSNTLDTGPVSAVYRGETLVLAQGAATFATASTWGTPSGMSQEAVQQSQGLAAGAIADQALTNAGATGTRRMTFGISTQLTGVMVALRPAQPTVYYHANQLASTQALTDSAGVVRATFAYDPYGNLTSQTGSATTPLLFNGQYRDAESSLYYLRARYYDPATGQFISRDPAVATTREPYAYTNDNPLNGTDPSGLMCLEFWDASKCSNPLTNAISEIGAAKGNVGAIASTAFTHTVISYGGCFIVCGSVAEQGGVVSASGGAFGLLGRGPAVGWANKRPQDRCNAAVGGGGAFGPGGQATVGSNADGQGVDTSDSEIDFFTGVGGWGGGNVTLISVEPGDNWKVGTGLHAP